jgi:hypothetical protein
MLSVSSFPDQAIAEGAQLLLIIVGFTLLRGD